MRYDVAIIGTGPAGLSAALTLKIRKKNFILLGNDELSPKLARAHCISNYLGFYNISGIELQRHFLYQLKNANISITAQWVNTVYAMGDYFMVSVSEEAYEATSIIVATGIQYDAAIPGEETYLGKGVSYCATCDGPIYKDKTIAVVSTTAQGESEANFLSTLAKTVYYIPLYEGERHVNEGIQIIEDRPTRIVGSTHVEKLILKNSQIETQGIFIFRDSIAPKQLVPGIETADNHIKADRLMKTNIRGCFAAGDIVGTPYQYIKAAGEGNIAALSAVEYLDTMKRTTK
jgi:thioredoxin reductase (NADPH)